MFTMVVVVCNICSHGEKPLTQPFTLWHRKQKTEALEITLHVPHCSGLVIACTLLKDLFVSCTMYWLHACVLSKATQYTAWLHPLQLAQNQLFWSAIWRTFVSAHIFGRRASPSEGQRLNTALFPPSQLSWLTLLSLDLFFFYCLLGCTEFSGHCTYDT